MKKRKGLLKGEEGFTMIEIIAVLIVLGILAAVAVPKFFDLAGEAREKALSGAVGEMKGRISQYFALQLLQGIKASSIDFDQVDTDLGTDFSSSINAFTAGTDTNITGVVKMLDGSQADSNWSMKTPGQS